MRRNGYYELRGSASPVLTATGLVNGRWQILTPTESTPLDRSPKTLVQVITSCGPYGSAKFGANTPVGDYVQIAEL